MRHVARHARGNPRVMDLLCTNMLLTGFTARQKPIAAHIGKDVVTTYRAKSSHARWWCGVTAAASILAVVGIVGLFPSTFRMVTEQSPRGFLPLTRGLRAGSRVETPQQSAQTGSSPSGASLSALPTSIEAASPPTAPTELSLYLCRVRHSLTLPPCRRPLRRLLRLPVSRWRRSIQNFPWARDSDTPSCRP